MNPKPLHRLFIANRGEIARRIAVTANRLGIQSVCIKAAGSAVPEFLHDVVATFVEVPSETTATYLDGAALVALAKTSGCDSLHPGFGFLSENAAFAAQCIEAGLNWVGPGPEAIQAMASKAAARERAMQVSVPCIPGLNGVDLSSGSTHERDRLLRFAGEVGYPLLLKAALGGGGKGMRLVEKQEQLLPAAERASSEARASFADGALIVERYIRDSRHVEVQVLGDSSGHVVAIGDRDCSAQRRHQKVIEEAPAPFLGSETRRAMHAAACRLAGDVGYVSAGTVEFLVDWSPAARGTAKQAFYFLEMNTRLQVEHPVTEEVFGLDLVEWQLRIAAGEKLPESFAHLAPQGHSVEVRIYAEDTEKGFLPAPGPVRCFRPATGPGVRWESGLDTVDEVSSAFDPMIAKLIVRAETRSQALVRLADALRRTFLAGATTNQLFLLDLVEKSPFSDGPVTTHYLDEKATPPGPSLAERALAKHSGLQEAAAAALAALKGGVGAAAAAGLSPNSHGGRAAEIAATVTSVFSRQQGPMAVASGPQAAPGTGVVRIISRHVAYPRLPGPSGAPAEPVVWGRLESALRSGDCFGFWYAVSRDSSGVEYHLGSQGIHLTQVEKRSGRGSGQTGAKETDIVAPVPGRVVAVNVKAGQNVKNGDVLAILESMKIEFEVRANRNGTITAVEIVVGEQVTGSQVLAHWE